MKKRKSRGSGVLYIIVGILLLGFLYRSWMRRTFIQKQEQFVTAVSPVVDQMRMFDELSLEFLSEDITTFSREVYGAPEGYIDSLKEQFSTALQQYNKSSEIRLLQELDAQELVTVMSLEKKVTQLFVFGFGGTGLDESMSLFLETHQPGGVILMGRNISETTNNLSEAIQKNAAKLPFFIAVDQEGGSVARFEETLPSQSSLTWQETCATYLERSEMLRKQGVNLNFGIIADTTDNQQAFIYDRVFRDDAERKIIDAVQCTTETLSTIKHFPGHGMTTEDTHRGAATVMEDSADREQNHLPVFSKGIDAGADLVMMAHLLVPWIDNEVPTSLSQGGITLLREQGFSGLIVTDDLGMVRGEYSEKEAIALALQAGNDLILLVNPSDPQLLSTYAADLIRDGLITQQDLDARFTRIIYAKNKIIKLGRYVPLALLQ